MAQEEREQYEDEINLMDYVKVILKRKRLILGLFFGAAIAAGVFSFILPKVYKIDTSLEIGQIAGAVMESPGQVVEKIDGDVYGIFVREKLKIPEIEYPKIKVENPKNTRLVKVAIESSKPEKAKNILEEVNNLILDEHQEIIEIQKGLLEKNIKTAEDKIKLVEADIQRIENKIKSTEEDIQTTRNKIKPVENDIERINIKIAGAEEEKESLEAKVSALQQQLIYEQTPGTQFALFDAKEKLANKKQEIEDLYLRINSLKRTIEDYNLQISSLQRKMEDYNSQINSQKATIENLNAQINSLRASLEEIRPTEVVKKPTISEQPVKPKKKLNIVIGGVLGLFIGVFLAFGKEWREQNR